MLFECGSHRRRCPLLATLLHVLSSLCASQTQFMFNGPLLDSRRLFLFEPLEVSTAYITTTPPASLSQINSEKGLNDWCDRFTLCRIAVFTSTVHFQNHKLDSFSSFGVTNLCPSFTEGHPKIVACLRNTSHLVDICIIDSFIF